MHPRHPCKKHVQLQALYIARRGAGGSSGGTACWWRLTAVCVRGRGRPPCAINVLMWLRQTGPRAAKGPLPDAEPAGRRGSAARVAWANARPSTLFLASPGALQCDLCSKGAEEPRNAGLRRWRSVGVTAGVALFHRALGRPLIAWRAAARPAAEAVFGQSYRCAQRFCPDAARPFPACHRPCGPCESIGAGAVVGWPKMGSGRACLPVAHRCRFAAPRGCGTR